MHLLISSKYALTYADVNAYVLFDKVIDTPFKYSYGYGFIGMLYTRLLCSYKFAKWSILFRNCQMNYFNRLITVILIVRNYGCNMIAVIVVH